MFLGENRKAFLDHLRNMTPQIIFLTVFVLSLEKINMSESIWGDRNFSLLVVAITNLALFLGSMVASISLFFESMLPSTADFLKELSATISPDDSHATRLWKRICLAASKHKKRFLTAMVCFAIVQFAFYSTIILAVLQTRRLV